MPFYASVEQVMRDRSELARKGIARGRSVAVITYAGGILFIGENPSTALHKISEIYDRIGFAAVGRYSEYENLRTAGIRLADMRGYSYDRKDVTGRQLANSYAHALSAIFTEQQKPYEVELCVAEVGASPAEDQLYRLTYDGSIVQETDFVVMGAQADTATASIRAGFTPGLDLAAAVELGVRALGTVGGNGAPRELAATQLEVAILDRARPARAFKRLTGAALVAVLPVPVEVPVAVPAEVPAEIPAEVPADVPAEAAEDIATEAAAPQPEPGSDSDVPGTT